MSIRYIPKSEWGKVNELTEKDKEAILDWEIDEIKKQNELRNRKNVIK